MSDQLTFQGKVFSNFRASLGSAEDLEIESPLEMDARVRGTFEGYVNVISFKDRKGAKHVQHIIVVDSFTVAQTGEFVKRRGQEPTLF